MIVACVGLIGGLLCATTRGVAAPESGGARSTRPRSNGADWSDISHRTPPRTDLVSVGIENAVRKALRDSGKFIPWQVITISTDGEILD